MDFSSPGTTEWLVIAGVVVLLLLIIVLIAVSARRRRRKESLQQRYGPEYDRTVRARGGDKAARADLSEREREHERLQLRDLDPREREGFGQRMAELQYRFVEDPAGAVYEAGRVAADALRARGYPITEDRDRALGLVAVDHPKDAQPLRTAIEGTYGKDPGRLRETFLGVRDSLREILGIHYGTGDRAAAAPTADDGAATGPTTGERAALAPASGDRSAAAAPPPAAEDAEPDRTVRLPDQTDQSDQPGPAEPGGDSRPVGAVPPPPGAETTRSG